MFLLKIIFFVAYFIQLFYYLFFFNRLAYYKPTKKIGTDVQPNKGTEKIIANNKIESPHSSLPVSVIICARNEAYNLYMFLPFVLQQDYPIFEVIIVDDDSSDETQTVLAALKQQYPNKLRIIETKGLQRTMAGKKFALSQGIEAAKYEYLLLTDADCKPASVHWIRQMTGNFNNKTEIILGYSPYISINSFLNKIIQFETLHTAIQYLSYCIIGIPYMGVGRNIAYRKKCYVQTKGFENHSKIPSGDDDLFINQSANSKNCCIEINPNSFCFSVPPQTWEAWFRQKKRHLSTGTHYQKKHKIILGLYTLSHLLFYGTFIVAIVNAKVVILLFFFIRLTIQTITFYQLQKKLQAPLLLYEIYLLDFLFVLYPLTFAFTTLKKTHQTSWK